MSQIQKQAQSAFGKLLFSDFQSNNNGTADSNGNGQLLKQKSQQAVEKPLHFLQQQIWLKHEDGMVSIPYPSSWQTSKQNSILYFFSDLQMYTMNETKDNVNLQIVISGEQTIEDLAKEVIENLSKLDGYELIKNITKGCSSLSKLESVCLKARYSMNGSTFSQVTYVLDCGYGLKYLFTYTSNTVELSTEPLFHYMLENSHFRKISELPWNTCHCQNCKIQFPQLWFKKMHPPALFLFSPIQLASNDRTIDNVVVQYITNGQSLEHDIQQLYDQLKERIGFKTLRSISNVTINKNKAIMFHVEYSYKGKRLQQITYLIKNGSDEDKQKWMLSYTSVGAQSKDLFEEMLRRFELKKTVN
jgi:hypothetical protein